MTLPQLLETKDVARVLGWPTWKARRWMVTSGAAHLQGGRWVTTPERLIAKFPAAYEALASAVVHEPEEAECTRCAELERQLLDLANRLARATQSDAKRRGRT